MKPQINVALINQDTGDTVNEIMNDVRAADSFGGRFATLRWVLYFLRNPGLAPGSRRGIIVWQTEPED